MTSAIVSWSSAASDGDRPRRQLRRRRQTLDPQHERVTQALRRRSAAVEPGGQELLGVQRVAFAAGEQPLHQLPARRVAEDVGQRLGQLVAVKRRQVDPAGALQPLQLGDQRAQRVAAVELVGCGS